MIPKKHSAAIKNWDVSDRPREKMSSQGISVLSNAELIAILIGSGNKKESALVLAKRILSKCQHRLHDLAQLNMEQLQQFKGIGAAKACSIITALELGKRSVSEKGIKQEKITCSRDVFDLMCPQIGTLKYEEFWVLYLNNSNKILKKIQLSKGGELLFVHRQELLILDRACVNQSYTPEIRREREREASFHPDGGPIKGRPVK